MALDETEAQEEQDDAPELPDADTLEKAMGRFGSAGVKVLSRAMKGVEAKQCPKKGIDFFLLLIPPSHPLNL
jgi:hypothetical protein